MAVPFVDSKDVDRIVKNDPRMIYGDMRPSYTSPRMAMQVGPEFFAALSKVQAAGMAASKDSFNPFFRSKYADLGSVWDAIRAPLTDNGFSVMQAPSVELRDGGSCVVTLDTIIAHSSGQYVTSAISAVPFRETKEGRVKSDDAQSIGACVTYLRRIALQPLVGAVVDDEDDDGNAASGRTQQAPQPPRPAAKPADTKPKGAPPLAEIDPTRAEQIRLWAIVGNLKLKGKAARDGGEISTIEVNDAIRPIIDRVGPILFGRPDGTSYIAVRDLTPGQVKTLADSLDGFSKDMQAEGDTKEALGA